MSLVSKWRISQLFSSIFHQISEKLDEKCCIFTLGDFYELKESESKLPSVKMTNIRKYLMQFQSTAAILTRAHLE